MNDHFGPGPSLPPPPGGLAQAFKAADRRRFRSAAIGSCMPVLVAFALAVAPGAGGPSGLEPAAPGVTASATPSATESATPETAPSGSAEPGDPSASASEEPGRPSETPGDPVSPRSPTPRPAEVVWCCAESSGTLTISGVGTSSATFTLSAPVSARLDGTTHTGGGDTYGFYLRAANRSAAGGVVHLPTAFSPGAEWARLGSFTDLEAGAYEVWLIGTGETTIEVPLTSGGDVEVETTTPETSEFQSGSSSAATGGTVEKRLPFTPTGFAVGLIGGRADTTARTSTTFDTCLTVHDAECADGDPHSIVTSNGPGTGPAAATVMFMREGELTPGETRDVLVRTETQGVNATVTAGWFLLYL